MRIKKDQQKKYIGNENSMAEKTSREFHYGSY